VKLSDFRNWDYNFDVIDWWIFVKLHISYFNYLICLSLFRKSYSILISVKRWHHTSSTAIMSYISNTFPNLQSAHDWTTGVKSVHRQQFKLAIFECLSHLLSHYELKPPARWPRHCFIQVITALTWAHNLLKGGTTLVAQLLWVIYLTISFFIFNKNFLIALGFKFNLCHSDLLWNMHIYYAFKTLKMFKINEICWFILIKRFKQ